MGVYHASGMAGDTAGMAALSRFVKAIGSRQRYSSMTVDHVPAMRAQEMVTGSAELLPTWVPEHPDNRFVLFVGCNPVVSHGYFTILPDPIRRLPRSSDVAGRSGWSIRTDEDRRARRRPRGAGGPGTDVVLLAWLVRELLAVEAGGDESAHDVERAPARPRRGARPVRSCVHGGADGCARVGVDALLAAIRAAGRIGVATGSGLLFAPDGCSPSGCAGRCSR